MIAIWIFCSRYKRGRLWSWKPYTWKVPNLNIWGCNWLCFEIEYYGKEKEEKEEKDEKESRTN